ncbi:MAG: methyltransferase domain-containing protein [Anaerolineales bacterium]|nr:methyltransferase domain-containing protein [Anaerolineales bacterium]
MTAEKRTQMNSLDIPPVDRPRQAAGEFYDRISGFYDLLAASSEGPFIRRGLKMLQARPGDRVLEIGSGTGRALVDLSRSVGPSGRVTGIDLSEGMMDIARERLGGSGTEEKADLIIGDAVSLPLRDGSRDKIFSSFTLDLFSAADIDRVLEECQRVLRTEGRLVVVALSQDQPLPPAGKAYQWLHTKFPGVIDCRPLPVRSLLERAGFQIRDHRRDLMWGIPVSITAAEK